MPSAPAARFVIRTASGDKGPFSQAQIASFVAGGKLPATARIFDLERQCPVTAAEAGAPALTTEVEVEEEAAPVQARATATATADAEPSDAPGPRRVDTNAATPGAPGLPAASATTKRSRKGTGRGKTVDQRRGRTATQERGVPRKRKSPWPTRLLVFGIVVLLLVAGLVVWMQSLKKDQFAGQADALLAQTVAHPDAVTPAAADAPFVRMLIKRDHEQALAAAKLQRGAYDGGKPAYDEAKYRDTLRAAIAKQVAEPDSALLTSCAKELAAADDPALSDVVTAKKLAQQAVTMDGEKNYLSLDALAWAQFKSNDPKRAALIEEQAASLAPDTATRTECEKALRKFRGGKAAEKAEE